MTEKHHWSEVEPLLDELLSLDDPGRQARLLEIRAKDAALFDALQHLLEASESDDSLLERGVAELLGSAIEDVVQDRGLTLLAEGHLLGPYRLHRRLGVGGMAEVWLAVRDDELKQQQVAIKVLHPLSGRYGRQRLEAEREILGTLQHDGIARILDASRAEDPVAYLVLEYVEGVSITEYCASRPLTERLNRFLEVCDAVEYAHGRLIIHRDLKPSNVLVSRDGRVKLVDFGIAKLLDGSVLEDLAVPRTRTGMRLLTPEYAAPEQILGSNITTATDIHALGLLLYELLTQHRAFDLTGQSAVEVERTVTEVETVVPVIPGSLGDDLRVIVAKALRKEPEQRYASVSALSADLRRCLEGLPILARPATLGYRVAKFARRNRMPLFAAGLVGAVLIGGIISTTWQAAIARAEAERANAVRNFLFGLFEAADPATKPGHPFTALDLLQIGAERMGQLDAGPLTEVDLSRILGYLFGRLGEHEKAETFLRHAVDKGTEHLDSHVATKEAMLALMSHLAENGDPEEARALAEQLLWDADLDSSSVRTVLGVALGKRGQYAEAETQLREAMASAPSIPVRDAAYMELGNLMIHQERWEEAETILREVAGSREAALGKNHIDQVVVLWNLGELLLKTARFAEAESVHREILEIRRGIFPQGHPDIARSLGQIGAAVQRQGRFDEAATLYAEAVAAWDLARFGSRTPALGEIYTNLATLQFQKGHFEQAIATQKSGLEVLRDIWGDQDDTIVAAGLNNLAVMYREGGDYETASRYLQDALQMRVRLHGEDHATVGMGLANLSRLRLFQGRFDEALEHGQAGLDICILRLPGNHPAVLASRMLVGAALVEIGEYDRAQSHLKPVLDTYHATLPEDNPTYAETSMWWALSQRNGPDQLSPEAYATLEQASATLTATLGEQARMAQRARRALEELSVGES